MITYKELIRRLANCEIFLNKVSLLENATRGRLYEYKKLVTQLDIARKKDRLPSYFKKISRMKSGFALKELYELVFILTYIEEIYANSNQQGKKEIVKRVKVILSGPTFTKQETANNSQARNYQFELLMGSRIYSAGLKKVSFSKNPDVSVSIYGRKYAMECKRITGDFDRKGLQRINEAIRQIGKVQDQKIFTGIIAIDISSYFEQGENWLVSVSRESAGNYIQRQLGGILLGWYQRSSKIREIEPTGLISGIFLNTSNVYMIQDKEFGWLNQIKVLALSRQNQYKAKKLEKDFSALSRERKL